MKKQAKKVRRGVVNRSETFDEFLARDGLLAEAEDAAIKEIIADQIKVAMDKKGLSKSAMAARMKTSRRQLDRLLDPTNTSVTLGDITARGERGGEEFEGGIGVIPCSPHGAKRNAGCHDARSAPDFLRSSGLRWLKV